MTEFGFRALSLQAIILRYLRGAEYLARYLFLERSRGLDFSMRNKASGITLPGNHGYALTSKRALKNILRHIQYNDKRLIDIGSGKGGVICFAHEMGIKTCEGVEYEEHLHQIAIRNIERLGYSPNVRSTRMDAREFSRYAEFDIYFLFNPFDYAIYAEVLNCIIEQNRIYSDKIQRKYLICYGDTNLEAVQASSAFSLVREERCPYRGNMIRIFELKM